MKAGKTLLYWVSATVIIASLSLGIYFNRYRSHPYTESQYVMDTYVTLKIYGKNPKQVKKAAQAAFKELHRLEELFNRFGSEESNVVRINQEAGKNPVQVSPEVWEIIQTSLQYGEMTSGAFDPTVGPLIDLWGITTENPRLPQEEEVKNILPLVNYKLVETDEAKRTVMLKQEGMVMDLGGSAKGYALDAVLKILKEHGIEHALVDTVSSTAALNSRPDGNPWKIAVQPPRALEGEAYLAILPVENQFISTSGDYQRFFEENGIRYHHILDPKSGYPARGVFSTTIITSRSGLEADILSTAVFVLGVDKGMELIESLPGVEGMIVDSNLKIHTSSGFQAEKLQSYH